jgi:hypothetical protein
MAELLTKPCLCGCGAVISTATIKPFRFAVQRFASRACSIRWRNTNDPVVVAGRIKGARSIGRAAGYMLDDDPGALIAPLSWLDQPPARIRAQRLAEGIVA